MRMLAPRGARVLPLRQREQAFVVLAAGRAALEVRAHAGDAASASGPRARARRTRRGARSTPRSRSRGLVRQPSRLMLIHLRSAAARSLRRASCSVLYRAPRVVPSRSASTSIGTPLSASAVNTSRWWRVSAVSHGVAHGAAAARRPRGPAGPRGGVDDRPRVVERHLAVRARRAAAPSRRPRAARTCTPRS